MESAAQNSDDGISFYPLLVHASSLFEVKNSFINQDDYEFPLPCIGLGLMTGRAQLTKQRRHAAKRDSDDDQSSDDNHDERDDSICRHRRCFIADCLRDERHTWRSEG